MKKILLIIAMTIAAISTNAQSCYWVFLTDKAGTTFDPYSYFDAKAIERYKLNNANLHDITNYPLSTSYVNQINAIATEEVGQSRWFNAIAVMATNDEIAKIEQLPFVKSIDIIASDMQIAEYRKSSSQLSNTSEFNTQNTDLNITDQLLRMRGDIFVEKGYNGTGIRIAVFDGGFHAVNTHKAFKHLRDNNQIISTWNFTNKTADVYDNHSHGTMVLSCIAGKMDDKLLGLATGATFLLAKTEVDPEPFKEEVWWAQAVEWADKNGADIINSSLGYTKDRHYTWEMDGRSYVSKAANLAARKGILVCNSAGNSGEDSKWKIIGAPADADSILSVGGIQPSLITYQHIGFSSYGPTADGRLKPNVCNFGYAEVADAHNDTATTFAAGTSFSSPLTTSFCACAWQAVRDKTAMQMKELIERSADLYPYYDYAFGYGVPQADFFCNKIQNTEIVPTFSFEDNGKFVIIHPKASTKPYTLKKTFFKNGVYTIKENEDIIMFKIQNTTGLIDNYVNLGFDNLDDNVGIAIPKAAIYGNTLVAYVNGHTDSFRLSKTDSAYYATQPHKFEYYVIDSVGYIQENIFEIDSRSLADNYVSNWGVGQKYQAEFYGQIGGSGLVWSKDDALDLGLSARLGLRFIRNFKKWYGIGLGLEWGVQSFMYDKDSINIWDNSLGLTANPNILDKTLDLMVCNIELFQRIRLINGGAFKKGLHWDLGIYGGLQGNNYTVRYDKNQTPNSGYQITSYEDVSPAADSYYNWGFTTRLVWEWIGIFGRYRMSQPDLNLPRLELGIQISL